MVTACTVLLFLLRKCACLPVVSSEIHTHPNPAFHCPLHFYAVIVFLDCKCRGCRNPKLWLSSLQWNTIQRNRTCCAHMHILNASPNKCENGNSVKLQYSPHIGTVTIYSLINDLLWILYVQLWDTRSVQEPYHTDDTRHKNLLKSRFNRLPPRKHDLDLADHIYQGCMFPATSRSWIWPAQRVL